MNQSTNKFKIILMIGLMLIAVNSISVLAYVSENGSGGTYVDPPTPDGADSAKHLGNMTVEEMVIEAAGYYLDANSQVQTLLRIIELQDNGIDAEEYNKVFDAAYYKTWQALAAYQRLVSKAEATPYNQTVLKKLKDFPYRNFRSELGLNKDVFGLVETYLATGNVTGIFKYKYDRMTLVMNTLWDFNHKIHIDKSEAVKVAWKINELFSECSLFGSYVARVFQSL